MKIALLHYSALPVVGGVESVLGTHARLMAEAGHTVRILAGRGEQPQAGVTFIHLPLLSSRHPEVLAVKAELDAGRVPPDLAELAGRIQAGLSEALAGVEVLVAHNVCSLHKNLALTAALYALHAQPGAPRLILWHHDLAWTTPRYRLELHDGYPWDLLRQDWPRAVQVVVSELRQNELAGLLGVPQERINVVPNGVDLGRFFKLEVHTMQIIRVLDLLAAELLLLLPVRITPRKNIELALHTLAALREIFPRAVLVVTGPLGPHNPANVEYFQRLLALRAQLGLEQAAHFLAEGSAEYLPDMVIADFYRLADALFLPSREEGFGIPVLEAGLAGLPIFCTDIAPLQKLGGEYATYFSADAAPQEVAALVAGRLANDAGFGMRKRVRGQYTWEQIYTRQIAPLLNLRGGTE